MINNIDSTHLDSQSKQTRRISIKEPAIKFEAIFIRQILSKMVPNDPLLKNSAENSIYRSMWIDSVSNLMAKSGDFGIADLIVKSFDNNDKRYVQALTGSYRSIKPVSNSATTKQILNRYISINRNRASKNVR